jgi:hypothetical protein
MHVARWIFVPILILMIVFISSPLAREEVGQTWEQVRPDVLQFMDGLYLAIRNFVAGGDMHKRLEEHPPGVDYDRIITMELFSSS